MSKHTPEPWEVIDRLTIQGPRVAGDPLKCGLLVASLPHWCEPGVSRRIVACVNACRGLPTDELEQKGLVAAVGTQLLELEQQRDGLLVALEELASDVEALMKESGGVYGLHQNGEPAPWAELVAGGKHEEWLLSLSDAVELIAKLKGGAA